MSKLLKNEVVKIEDGWIHGFCTYDDGMRIPYMKMEETTHKEKFWFLQSSSDIFSRYGWKIDAQKIDALLALFNHDIVALTYYLYAASNENSIDLVVNILLGPVAEWKKNHSVDQTTIPIDALELKDFVLMVQSDSFINSKYKDAMLCVLDGESLTDIRNNSSYWAADTDELKELISTIIQENADKIKSDNHEKMINWLTGQVMKASKGKANPTDVKLTIQEML